MSKATLWIANEYFRRWEWMFQFKDTVSFITQCYYQNYVDSVSFNAVDVTVLIRPDTRSFCFHPPPSLALEFFLTQTFDTDFGVLNFLNTNFNSGTPKFPISSESDSWLGLKLRFQNVYVYYFFFFKNV